MADTTTDPLIRTSPLAGYDSRFATLPDSARVVEEPFVAMVDLWVDAGGPGATAAAHALGVDALPAEASTITGGVIWLGPGEWLVTSTSSSGDDLEATLRHAVAAQDGAAVDVSAQRTTLRVSGAHARDILAKGCSLDLHPAVFRPGQAPQTMLDQAAVVLIPLSDDGTDYRVLVRASFARHLADWLIDAAQEFMGSTWS